MWPFRKRISLKDSGIFKNFTDCHSHILPGVDDGVQTMEEALEILRLYEELGIKSVWLTPHIMEDMPNTTLHLRERYAELQATYSGPIKLHLASENMLDNLFEERLEKNDLLPLGESGDHLLVETSYFNPQFNLPSIAGMYGNRIKKKAMLLLKEKAITHIGTDIHNYNIFQKFICTSITKNIQNCLIDSQTVIV